MLRHFPESTKIVFFDLEYYVPLEDRSRKAPSSMKFSPYLPGHKILGGMFQTYFPMTDELRPAVPIWEWKVGSEKRVLEETLSLLKREWKGLERGDRGSLMLCGIGISHSDVPALLAKMNTSLIDLPTRIYDCLCGCRQIDLSTATYCQFSSKTRYFSYPKSKAALYNKYLVEPANVAPGTSVWDDYEAGRFGAIEARTQLEVDHTVTIYKRMFDIRRETESIAARLKKLQKLGVIPPYIPKSAIGHADGLAAAASVDVMKN